jgi:hypothetical protein
MSVGGVFCRLGSVSHRIGLFYSRYRIILFPVEKNFYLIVKF